MIGDGASRLAKAVALLATVFVVSLGLCGLDLVAVMNSSGTTNGSNSVLIFTAYLGSMGMVVSGAGLIVVAVVAIVRGAISNFSSKGSGPVSIIEKDEDK
jgi:hypothetical protein